MSARPFPSAGKEARQDVKDQRWRYGECSPVVGMAAGHPLCRSEWKGSGAESPGPGGLGKGKRRESMRRRERLHMQTVQMHDGLQGVCFKFCIGALIQSAEPSKTTSESLRA